MQGAVSRFDSEPDSFFVGEAAQPAVTDHDAFGDTGGAGRVDEVCRIVVAQARTPLGVVDRCIGMVRGVQFVEEQPIHRIGEPAMVLPHTDSDYSSRIGEHVPNTILGVVRIDREEGTAGLGHRPRRGHRFERPRQRKGDIGAGADSPVDQFTGECVRLGVEIPVAHLTITENERWGIGVHSRGPAENIGEGQRGGRGRSPRRYQGLTLEVVEEIEVSDRRSRGCCCACKDPHQSREEGSDRGFGVVLRGVRNLEGAGICVDVDRHVEAGNRGLLRAVVEVDVQLGQCGDTCR